MPTPEPKSSVPLVRVENISKHFGSVRALCNISFELNQGEILGFLGPNGSGKTTTMRILTGYFPPTYGKIWIEGRELYKYPERIKKKIGYLPEHVILYPQMTVSEFLDFVGKLRGLGGRERRKEVESKVALCGLGDVRKRMIGNLSKGFRQRAGIAQALIGNPRFLVLDEPTSGLDPEQIIEIRNLIRDLGKENTVILSTHILPEVSMLCDRVLIIRKGKIIAGGTPQELERNVSAQPVISVVIGEASRKDEALSMLQSLEGVQEVSVVEETPVQVRFSVSVGGEQDLRPVITRIFVERGISILELQASRMSLEDVFVKLVKNESVEKLP